MNEVHITPARIASAIRESIAHEIRRQEEGKRAKALRITESVMKTINNTKQNLTESTNGEKTINITATDLRNLVNEAVLNELDWKTYMNAAKKVADADRDFRDGRYTNPVVLKTITRAFAKKFGMKKAKMIVDGLSDEQFDELVDMLGLYPSSGLHGREDALKNATTDAFARKYGHSRKVDHFPSGDYMPSLETVDPEGNVYNMQDGFIETPEGDLAVQFFPNSKYNPWDTNGQEGERLKNSDAMQDLAKYHNGESRYNKDTHQYEALKRRLVDRLLESTYDPFGNKYRF